MTINLFQTAKYKAIMAEHLNLTIAYLFSQNQEFGLACDVKNITFNPELPEELKERFDETVLFILSGYTLESSTLEDGYFTFEAGFGADNFGARVTVPLLAIRQVLVGDNPIVLNHAQYSEAKPTTPSKQINSSSNSMEALLKNPENKKLFKKRK